MFFRKKFQFNHKLNNYNVLQPLENAVAVDTIPPRLLKARFPSEIRMKNALKTIEEAEAAGFRMAKNC